MSASGVLEFLIIISAVLQLATSLSPALILTPYIERNKNLEARKLSTVTPSRFLNITSHSGFLTVDSTYNSNLFFWYFPVSGKPVNETPWIVWLQGGPGAASMDGLFDEIGPFQYSDNQLKPRNISWCKDYSMLFIDNPVGAGFSFTNHQKGMARSMKTVSKHLYDGLQQFLKIFPELRKAPLFIAGESYAGHYVPHFGNKILESNAGTASDSAINLHGLIMGNPVVNRESVANYADIYYGWGLIDAQGRLAVKSLQDAYLKAIEDRDLVKAPVLRNDLLDKLMDIAFQTQMYNVLEDAVDLEGFVEFLEQKDTREAIHVGDISFTFSNGSVKAGLLPEFFDDVTPQINSLLDHYRLLVYCGQLDLVAPCAPTALERRKKWQWNLKQEFMEAPRKPWWFNNTLAGYYKSGGRFTEVLVRDAGHLVPIDKSAQAQELISYFIRGLDLPVPQNYVVATDSTPDFVDPDAVAQGEYSRTLTAMIVSVLVNVILIVGIAAAVVYFLRWKKNNEAFFYAPTEDSMADGILTMS